MREKKNPRGNRLNIRSSIVGAILCFCAVGRADVLYDINFSQFQTGTVYVAASGPPSDFSGYATNNTISYIVDSYLGLANQPLVTFASTSSRAAFSMGISNASSSLVTLDFQLALDSNVDARVDLGGIVLRFGLGTDNAYLPNAVTLLSALYTNSISLVRPAELLDVHLSLNTVAETFDVEINNSILAMGAPYGVATNVDDATIQLGDLATVGAGGEAGIDNILLTVSPIPEPRTFALVAGALALLVFGRKRDAHRA